MREHQHTCLVIQVDETRIQVLETAKANNLEPYGYLTQILKALPYADTVEKIEALLPWNFKKMASAE
jgi:hypothetical protein